jgi:hypothetical protein
LVLLLLLLLLLAAAAETAPAVAVALRCFEFRSGVRKMMIRDLRLEF